MAYEIFIERGYHRGKLRFKSGAVDVSTPCWWDPTNVIDAKSYEKCSATRMASKLGGSDGGNREGIYFGRGVPSQNNTNVNHGIFIHKYVTPKNPVKSSDGCIVIAESEMMKIWNTISPKDGKNVTVHVTDPYRL